MIAAQMSFVVHWINTVVASTQKLIEVDGCPLDFGINNIMFKIRYDLLKPSHLITGVVFEAQTVVFI